MFFRTHNAMQVIIKTLWQEQEAFHPAHPPPPLRPNQQIFAATSNDVNENKKQEIKIKPREPAGTAAAATAGHAYLLVSAAQVVFQGLLGGRGGAT